MQYLTVYCTVAWLSFYLIQQLQPDADQQLFNAVLTCLVQAIQQPFQLSCLAQGALDSAMTKPDHIKNYCEHWH